MRKNGDDGVHTCTPRSRSKADDILYSVALHVLLGAMIKQITHYTRSPLLYYLLALAGSILTL